MLPGTLSASANLTWGKPRRMKMQREGKRRDVEKERYWRKVIGEAARGEMSVRQFCRERTSRERGPERGRRGTW
jgi:hypothetical protein